MTFLSSLTRNLNLNILATWTLNIMFTLGNNHGDIWGISYSQMLHYMDACTFTYRLLNISGFIHTLLRKILCHANWDLQNVPLTQKNWVSVNKSFSKWEQKYSNHLKLQRCLFIHRSQHTHRGSVNLWTSACGSEDSSKGAVKAYHKEAEEVKKHKWSF